MISVPQYLFLSAVLTASCASVPTASIEAQAKKGGAPAKPRSTSSSQPTTPTMEFVPVKDPVEQAYTVSLPKGWHNRAYMARTYDIYSMVDVSVSPNGSVLLFSGDPGMPQFYSPQAATEIHYAIAKNHPAMRIEPFQPATQFFPDYVRRKFGRLKDFKITGVVEDEALLRKNQKEFAQAGVQGNITTAKVSFRYTDGGKPMRALILGGSVDFGAIWVATVTGITTTGDPERYLPMSRAIDGSRRISRAWQQKQNALHQQRMAQIQAFGDRMTAQHERNMAWIQSSAQRHQERMNAIHAQGDASMQRYYDRMASGDAQHRNFLNYINEENTVASASGKTYQVDGSYQRYFMHKRTEKYVGGDTHTSIDDLRKLGLNPDDYEEVKIKK
ncbi:MAG: hypothetical protein ACO1SV_27810 [Fimbriimonas sp.]